LGKSYSSAVPGRRPGAPGGRTGRAKITSVETRSIAVVGMSCDHCANAVRAEIGKLPGVTEVDVDVAAGKVRVTGTQRQDDAALRGAVEEAGYEFAG
jgi:copper chaperone